MNTKNLFYTIILFGLLWSCGKDDAPTPAVIKNNAPTISDQSFTVSEDITDEKSIGTVKATDTDGDKLTFTIIANDNNLFEISELGVLSLASGKSLDYETAVEHVIKISISDGTDQKEANITIDVTNVKDSLSEDTNSFITKWEIPYDNFELIIGTNEDYEYDFIIDWGDGSPVEEITSQNPSHVYGKAGVYFISIQGDFPAIQMGHLYNYPVQSTLIGIQQWGSIVWQSFYYAFGYCNFLVEYNATDAPNLENVETMNLAFFGATRFNADLNNWDVSNVKKMGAMFSNAYAFNGDIGNWDVGNVINMDYMFDYAKEFNQNLGSWNIQNVETMTGMFNDSGMSPENFSETMIGWASNPNLQPYIPIGIEGMSLCSDNQDAIDAMVFRLNIELEWGFSSPPDMVDCSGN